MLHLDLGVMDDRYGSPDYDVTAKVGPAGVILIINERPASFTAAALDGDLFEFLLTWDEVGDAHAVDLFRRAKRWLALHKGWMVEAES